MPEADDELSGEERLDLEEAVRVDDPVDDIVDVEGLGLPLGNVRAGEVVGRRFRVV